MKPVAFIFCLLVATLAFAQAPNSGSVAYDDAAIKENIKDLHDAEARGDWDAVSKIAADLKRLTQARKRAVAGPKPLNHNDKSNPIDRVFKTWQDYGFSLSKSPDADGATKGAEIGFTNDRHAGTPTSYNAQFYLRWDLMEGPLKGIYTPPDAKNGGLYLNSLALSAQGKVDSTDNSTADAWRFRFETNMYEEFNPRDDAAVNGILSILSAIDESNRDFNINRVGVEWWLTPMAQNLCVGRYSGTPDDWVRVRWRPYIGLDAGGTTTDTLHAFSQQSSLWLMAKGKVDISLNGLQHALKLQGVILSAEDRVVYLAETDTTHNYFVGSLNVDFTDSLGFALDYTVGEDSPAFTREDVMTGNLTVKF